MVSTAKTKKQLIQELAAARRRVAELEGSHLKPGHPGRLSRNKIERFQAALRHASMMVWNQDAELRYTWIFNPHGEFRTEDVLGKTDAEPLPSEDTTALAEIERRVLDSGVGVREEVHTTLNGEKRFYDMAVEPLCNDAGVVEGVTCAALDITERKRIEQKLRRFMENLGGMVEERTAELSDANEKLHSELKERRRLEVVLLQSQKMDSIGRLAGGVAHDLNNLLTPIMGYVSVAMASLQPEHPMQSKLQGIQKAAKSASELTLQLLAFSRNQVMDPALINLSDLILSMDKLLRRLIIEDIELVCVPGTAVGSVKVDPAQMEQVLMNLAVNARDAMPEGGRLVIETTDVTLDDRYASRHPGVTAGDYVSLVVSDNGIGMTEEVKRHAFEPFFTTKEVGEGTGLGLSTCYGIVKQSGGHITVDSEPGQGTTFKIYIPRVDGEPSAQPSRDDSAYSPRGSETVLLAEDEPTVRGVITDVLSESGYRVLEATNGHEALSVAQEHCGEEIHLLLTDVVMPLMGGRELAEILRAKHPNLKVLYTSGYADDAIDRHGVLEPDAEFMQKPFTLDVLTQKVRKALETG